MSPILRNVFVLAVVVGWLCGGFARAESRTNLPAMRLQSFTDALIKSDYKLAMKNANDEVKRAMPESMFKTVANRLGPILGKKHKMVLLGDLKQRGCSVYVYKAEFEGGGDDIMVVISLKNDLLAGVYFY